MCNHVWFEEGCDDCREEALYEAARDHRAGYHDDKDAADLEGCPLCNPSLIK